MSIFNNTEKMRKLFYVFVPLWGSLLLLSRYGKTILSILLPFIAAYIVSKILRNPTEWLTRHWHLPRKVVAFFTVLFFYAAIGCLLVFLVIRLAREAAVLSDRLCSVVNDGALRIAELKDKILRALPSSLAVYAKNESASDALAVLLKNAAASMARYAKNFAVSLPRLVLGTGVTVLASCYFTGAPYGTEERYLRRLPEKARNFFVDFQEQASKIGGKYLRAYGTLAVLTFCELFACFLPLIREYALLAAVAVTLVDILPVFGTGTVLLPWVAIEWIHGDGKRGVALLLIYVFVSAVRQWAEPKILGAFMGISPPIALFCMYAGGKLFGFVGLFLVPFAAVVVKGMQDCGSMPSHGQNIKTPKEKIGEAREKYKRYRKGR